MILGAGGHGRAVADLAVACGFTVAGFTDRAPGPRTSSGRRRRPGRVSPRAGRIDGAHRGGGQHRARAPRRALRACSRPPAWTRPAARPSARRRLALVPRGRGRGGVCRQRARRRRRRSGDNAVIYSGVIAEHDCRIGDARVSRARRDALRRRDGGDGRLPRRRRGHPAQCRGRRAGAVVAAGAVVTATFAAGGTVMGVPARRRAPPSPPVPAARSEVEAP